MNRKDIKKDHCYVLNNGRVVKVQSYLIKNGLLCGVSFYNYYPDSFNCLDVIARKATKEETQKCEEEIKVNYELTEKIVDDSIRKLKLKGIFMNTRNN